MKKNLLLLSSLFIALSACTPNTNEDSSLETNSSQTASESSQTSDTSSSDQEDDWNMYGEDYSSLVGLDTINDASAKDYLPEDGSYETETFIYDDVRHLDTYVNNKKVANNTAVTEDDDVRYVYYNNNSARYIDLPEGYAITIPTDTTMVGDFSLGAYRSKLYNEESTLTVTYETSSPYGNTTNGWHIYRDEWIVEYFLDDKIENYLEKNRLQLTQPRVFEDTTILRNYSIIEYSIEILEPGLISKMFYNIGVIRNRYSYNKFYLLVMKSNKNKNEEFRNIIKSFTLVDSFGKGDNSTYYNLPANDNPNWNEATKNYYNKLKTQETVDWGFYKNNLPSSGKDASNIEYIQNNYKKAFDCDFQILSSYAHISYSRGFMSGRFPKDSAKEVCGNGFDGKPVIQFNYQFTDNNNNLGVNNTTDNFSPMFDILRGDNGNTNDLFSYQNEAEFNMKILARYIKEYGKPVLFRLNNEMNSDWTSYCGMLNLLDPDLFAASWRRLYNIFEKEGVDNCIWIFNPFTPGTPYSSWGKAMCYFPGEEYVQVLGVTYYVMNNENEATTKTFKYCYTQVYEDNKDYWLNYPWIISEFGCGSGGATSGTLYRNEASQAQWVTDMFSELEKRDDYCKNIKGAVWFSANDYGTGGKISNALEIVLDKNLTTVAAFKNGLRKNKNK